MAENFEKKLSSAHCVAKWDMCCLIMQTFIIICLFVLKFKQLYPRLPYSNEKDFSILIMVFSFTLLIAIIAFFAICQLTEATTMHSNVNVEKALLHCRCWYYLNTTLLFIGSSSVFLNLTLLRILAHLIWAAVRIYMICKVNKYMEFWEEYILEKQDKKPPGLLNKSDEDDLV